MSKAQYRSPPYVNLRKASKLALIKIYIKTISFTPLPSPLFQYPQGLLYARWRRYVIVSAGPDFDACAQPSRLVRAEARFSKAMLDLISARSLRGPSL